MCFVTRSFIFNGEASESIDIVAAIDWDVLVLLSAIMVINKVVVSLQETKLLVEYLQKEIQQNPRKV